MSIQVIFEHTSDIAIDVIHTNVHVDRIIKALGNHMTLRGEEFELAPTPHHVLISGDDSYGTVTQISVCNGHLILIANFGDEGEMIFSPTAPRGNMQNDLRATLMPLIDNESILVDDVLFINSMDSYIIGQSYNCMDI